MYFVILDGVQHRTFSSNEYVEALEHAAQLDFIYNSPELNDGIQGNHIIKFFTLPEMMMSDVEMVIGPGVSRGIECPTQLLPPAEMGTAHTTERHERLQHR